jgi:hypothetical protein
MEEVLYPLKTKRLCRLSGHFLKTPVLERFFCGLKEIVSRSEAERLRLRLLAWVALFLRRIRQNSKSLP